MFFLDFNMLILQILPPHWRHVRQNTGTSIDLIYSAKFLFLKTVATPFKFILNALIEFRISSYKKVNLTAQSIVIENHVRGITGLLYGVYIVDSITPGHFELNVPVGSMNHQNEITQFLQKVVPAGRIYSINFY